MRISSPHVEVRQHVGDVAQQVREARVLPEGLEELLAVEQRVDHFRVLRESVREDAVDDLEDDSEEVRVDV